MKDRRIILGIDTSNYTTSAALMYDDGELLANIKCPLSVKDGEHGLRQSDAVFAHIKNIPVVMSSVRERLCGRLPYAIGVSASPRNIAGSYMPCFLTGVAVAEGISAATSASIYKFSHQCGHIMAALYSSGRCDLADGKFAAFHVSGGTTELLRVSGGGYRFDTEIVGGAKDLNAGQIIDRIGVHLGTPFPAGHHLEELALMNKLPLPKKKVSVRGTYANLSGLENMAVKLFEETGSKELTAGFVLEYIGNSICEICDNYINENGDTPIVFAGGVMCNSLIKSKLSSRFEAYFAEPMMSADNAVGIAALTLKQLKSSEN